MAKSKISTAMKNLKKNCPLLLSAAAALCLFLSPSMMRLLLIAAVFALVSVLALLDRAKPSAFSDRFVHLSAGLAAMVLMLIGYHAFKLTWAPSGRVATLANALSLPAPTLLTVIAAVGCAVGFYALYIFSCWVFSWTLRLFCKLSDKQKEELIANWKNNRFFPISAAAFFFLQASLTPAFYCGIVTAFFAALFAASSIPSMIDVMKQTRMGLHAAALLTAAGICLHAAEGFYANWPLFPQLIGLQTALAAVFGCFFVYFLLLVFWKTLARVVSENALFDGVRTPEWIVYGLVLAASLVFMAVSFAQTEAFYGTAHEFDIIYTGDSPILVQDNIYLTLIHKQNDIRQPLFAVFAAPFVGIPYLIGRLFAASAWVRAALLNLVQVAMLFLSNFMLAKMMQLGPKKRICFLLLTSCTYTYLLFTLMMEQYIVAYFWLILCLYLISCGKRPNRLVLWGTGGTLVTGMLVLPFMSENSPLRAFKAWLCDMVKYGLEFVAVILVFCRYDVFFNLASRVSLLVTFVGTEVSFFDKVCQYTAFIKNCFAAPNAGVNTTAFAHASWQLQPVTGINPIGTSIFLLAIVSAVVNRDKKSSLLAVGWLAFSLVMLLGLGWGTAENGLILYSLYFGWAFFVLLFQLAEKIETVLHINFLVPLVGIGGAAVLAAVNFPAITELLQFAIAHYPA